MNALSRINHTIDAFEVETGHKPDTLFLSDNIVSELVNETVDPRSLTATRLASIWSEVQQQDGLICGLPFFLVKKPDVVACTVMNLTVSRVQPRQFIDLVKG